MRALLAGVLVLLNTTFALAQTPDTTARADRVRAAYTKWLDDQSITGTLALRRQGREVATVNQGKSAQDPAELASVAKAITAKCTAKWLAQTPEKWQTPLQIAGFETTLGRLVTHSSGLEKDSTQRLMRRNFRAEGPHIAQQVANRIIKRGGPSGQPDTFSYNNENYALLALAIEAQTGRSYLDACRDAVLAPLNISATASPLSGAFLPWGGWHISASEFARWHAHTFGAHSDYAKNPGQYPNQPVGGGAYYGLGTFYRTLPRGNTFWHFGALCFPGRHNSGSFAATWFADWTAVALYDGCVSWDAMGQLDHALVEALFGEIK